MFLNLLSIRAHFKKDEASEFQIDDTYSVPVGGSFVNTFFILHSTPTREWEINMSCVILFHYAHSVVFFAR